MGGFYGNITIKGASQEEVARALRGRRAVVSTSVGGYTVAFDSACDEQNMESIKEVTSKISNETACPALAIIVHDDDVFCYLLYTHGQLADSYNSNPNYFVADNPPARPLGGDAGFLCSVFGADAQNEVEAVLRKTNAKDGYVFATDRHRDLVQALGLPPLAVGNALATFERPGAEIHQMLWAPGAPNKEMMRQRKQELEDRKFYDGLGPENPSTKCRHEGCQRGTVQFSVFCRTHHFEMIKRYACSFSD